MARTRTQAKTYIYLRSHAYKPDKFIKLGQALKDPTAPWELELGPPLELDGEPEVSTDAEFVATNSESTSFAVGGLLEVLDFVKGSAEAHHSAQELLTWSAGLVETVYFVPSHGSNFDEKINANAKLSKWLKRRRFLSRSAYIITGLKIARKPRRVTFRASEASNAAAAVQAVLDPQGAVKAGVKAESAASDGAEVKSTPLDDYIIAYQLRKVSASWLSGKAHVGALDKKGDIYGAGGAEEPSGTAADRYMGRAGDEDDSDEYDHIGDGAEDKPDPNFVGFSIEMS